MKLFLLRIANALPLEMVAVALLVVSIITIVATGMHQFVLALVQPLRN